MGLLQGVFGKIQVEYEYVKEILMVMDKLTFLGIVEVSLQIVQL